VPNLFRFFEPGAIVNLHTENWSVMLLNSPNVCFPHRRVLECQHTAQT
jgi:hypothetical protein